jgi:phosphoglycerol transferase MdoB-like AlkP superfamily enzyme
MRLDGKRIWELMKLRLPILLFAIIPVWVMELLSRGRFGESFIWIFQHISEFAGNVLLVFILLLLFTSLIGRTRIAFWSLSAILIILSLISGIKLKMLGVPLLPWDFVLSGETQDMLKYLNNILSVRIIAGIVLFIAISYALLYRTVTFKNRFSWKERGITAAVSILLLIALYTDRPLQIRNWSGIHALPWNQSQNVQTNGFALTTMMNTQIMFTNQASGFTDQDVSTIIDTISPSTKPEETAVKPNIVVILSEAFWDPTVIKGTQFSQDPIPFFHHLQQNYSSGTMLSPQFGGGTANVEFEVLTGNSMRFLPQGSIPYNQYIDHGVDSLASILARQGYTSTAINPFYSWFFNSKTVYQNFGFSSFIPIEYFKPHYEGPYIADSEVADNVIAKSDATPGPDFIFTNTMENHFHFYPGKFKENTFKIKGDMTEAARGMLETLAQGMNANDKMLQTIVEHFEKKKEPTIVVFFGDHLPYLGDDYQGFIESKYLDGKNDPDFLNKMYRVPVVVWNNYLPAKKEQLDMSPSFLGPYVLKQANLKGSSYTDFLYNLYQKIPVIPPSNYYEGLNIKEDDLKNYEILQKDILFGHQVSYQSYTDPIISKVYQLGFGPMQINKVTPSTTEISGKTEMNLTVEGTNFPPLGVVTVNGKNLPTTYLSENTLMANVESSLLQSGTLEIQVRVIDSKETVIGKSNTWPLDPGAH